MENISKELAKPSETTPLMHQSAPITESSRSSKSHDEFQTESVVVAMRQPKYGFDWTYVKRFCGLHRFLFAKFKSLSVLLLAALVGVCGVEQYLTYKIGLIPGQYYKCLGAKDYQDFLSVTLVSVIVIVSMVSLFLLLSALCRKHRLNFWTLFGHFLVTSLRLNNVKNNRSFSQLFTYLPSVALIPMVSFS